MDFGLTESQEGLQRLARRFAREEGRLEGEGTAHSPGHVTTDMGTTEEAPSSFGLGMSPGTPPARGTMFSRR